MCWNEYLHYKEDKKTVLQQHFDSDTHIFEPTNQLILSTAQTTKYGLLSLEHSVPDEMYIHAIHVIHIRGITQQNVLFSSNCSYTTGLTPFTVAEKLAKTTISLYTKSWLAKFTVKSLLFT